MSRGPCVTLERAEERDVAALADMDAHASPEAWGAREIAAGLRGAHRDLLMLCSYGRDADGARRRMLAYCALQLVGPEAEIHRLVVRADERRRGWGRRLLRLVLAKVERDGAATAWLEVRASNAAARALYAAEGFAPAFRRPGYYRAPPEDAWVLRRRLGGPPAPQESARKES